jgi:hypothetical protein
MKTLKKGDIGIAQFFDNFPEYNGQECTVLDGLEFRGLIMDDMTTRENVLRYRVQFPDGQILGPLPHQLRPRPDPDEKHATNDEQYLPDAVAA